MALKEIHERENHGIRVTLHWNDESNTMTVEVEDRQDPSAILALTGIPPGDSLLAFEHPFSYVPPKRSPFEATDVQDWLRAVNRLKGIANDDYRCY